MERWALSKGFHKMDDELREKGYLFWKEGRYFSKAQLVVHINNFRLERDLPAVQLSPQQHKTQELEEAE